MSSHRSENIPRVVVGYFFAIAVNAQHTFRSGPTRAREWALALPDKRNEWCFAGGSFWMVDRVNTQQSQFIPGHASSLIACP
jgi:hypothetical protein